MQVTAAVVDRDANIRRDMQTVLTFLGADVHSCSPRDAGGMKLPANIDVALLGPSETSLPEVLQQAVAIPVVVLGDSDLRDRAAGSQRQQLVAQVGWPLAQAGLVDALHRAELYRRSHSSDPATLREQFAGLVGATPGMDRVRAMMGRVVDKDVNVFITGESGTGKEVVARALHDGGPRAAQPFVPVNCGAIPAELLESELFGHERGAFTGAVTSKAGRFELASGGTLFLDEIGDLPLHMQVKLLRVIQERCFERVGGTATIRTDVRLIAATHRNLEQMIKEGEFREDLFYRLNVFPIELPSLRERVADLDLLINELNRRMVAAGQEAVRFNTAARLSLSRHPWSGNVRELANLVERMAIMSAGGVVGEGDLPSRFRHLDDGEDTGFADLVADESHQDSLAAAAGTPQLPVNGIDLKDYLNRLERQLIEQALEDTNSVVARAADRLHIRRTTLVEKMRKYGISRTEAAAGQAGSAD